MNFTCEFCQKDSIKYKIVDLENITQGLNFHKIKEVLVKDVSCVIVLIFLLIANFLLNSIRKAHHLLVANALKILNIPLQNQKMK